ncbi:MAG: putative lipid II flippase FtsW [Planctomycetaceae bacterium]|nr:putative lipid II flippase FtsW [Planctomycetaceae bacterium]
MRTLEKSLISVAGLLLALGLLMVYSASITSRPSEQEQVYLSRQVLFLTLAVAVAAGSALLPADWWRRLAPALFVATVVLLVAVLVPSLGVSVKGARRWLRIGGYSMQPSEVAKLTLPLLLCRLTADGRWRTQHWLRSVIALILPVATTLGLVVVEPDLGTTLFLTATSVLALYFSGWPLRRFLIVFGLMLPTIGTVAALRPYQLARVQGFLAAWQDFNQAPYQLKQSLTALGSGGLFGTGLGLGQQKLSFLPEANTDFVFAVIGEELGLLGTLGVILLWGALFGLGVRLLAPLRRGSFAHAAGLTLLTSLVLQAVLNMAVVLALVPPKGISLPLISYGGSSLLVSLTSLGMILSFSRAIPEQDELETLPTGETRPAA